MSYQPKPPPVKGRHLYKHGYSGTGLYGRWRRMIQRCSDPNADDYIHYGARGIKVCERWQSFANFLADMGEPPTGHSLDRINPSGDYSPDNCRWVTQSVQMRNTRATRYISFGAKTQCLSDWAAELGIDTSTLRYRLQNWPIEKALSAQLYSTNGKAR